MKMSFSKIRNRTMHYGLKVSNNFYIYFQFFWKLYSWQHWKLHHFQQSWVPMHSWFFFSPEKKNESLHTHPKNSRKPGKYETIRVGLILAKVTKCCKMWFDEKFFNLGRHCVKSRKSLSLKKYFRKSTLL